MPRLFLLGEVDAFAVSVNLHRNRAIVKAKTQNAKGAPVGVKLESLIPGPNQFFPAMVLVHRDWRNLYFLIEREGWTEDDYFRHAERLLDEKRIINP